jgi:hypothetical protein
MEEVGWKAIGIDWRIEWVVSRVGIVTTNQKMDHSCGCDAA